MRSDQIVDRARNDRRKHARELLAEHENDWDGNSDLNELAGSKYAVVWKSDSTSWVLRAADAADIAAHYLDAAHGPDGPDYEWIEGVIDLDTGEDVLVNRTLTVRVSLPNGVTAAATN